MAIDPLTGVEKIPPVIDPNATQITPPTSGLINATAPATTIAPATAAPTSTTPNAQVYGAPTTQGWNVTDNQTVEGRIKGLIDANSPLMQQAATTGLQNSNARGLANSSMSVGASQAEVLKAATPIATADANIHANAAQFNAIDPNKQLAITSSEKLAGMNIAADMDKLTTELASRKDLSNADIAARKDQLVTEIISREKLSEADRTAVAARLDTELASRERIATMENDTRIKLAGNEEAYKLLVSQSQGAASLYDTYQKAVNAIMTSTMNEENKQAAINVQYQVLQAGMKMYSDVESIGLDQIVNGEAPIVDDPLAGIDEASAVAKGMPPGLTLAQRKAWFAANPEIGAQILALNGIAPNAVEGISDAISHYGDVIGDALGF